MKESIVGWSQIHVDKPDFFCTAIQHINDAERKRLSSFC